MEKKIPIRWEDTGGEIRMYKVRCMGYKGILGDVPEHSFYRSKPTFRDKGVYCGSCMKRYREELMARAMAEEVVEADAESADAPEIRGIRIPITDMGDDEHGQANISNTAP